jgi:hypothetical protein
MIFSYICKLQILVGGSLGGHLLSLHASSEINTDNPSLKDKPHTR